jgi:putative ABC transport system permease protein
LRQRPEARATACTLLQREIGALRAIGMTRRQLTRMIRIESEITALIGAAIGIIAALALALALAALATASQANWKLHRALVTLFVLAAAAFLSGVAAGAFPARRAAHLDPLQALHYDRRGRMSLSCSCWCVPAA